MLFDIKNTISDCDREGSKKLYFAARAIGTVLDYLEGHERAPERSVGMNDTFDGLETLLRRMSDVIRDDKMMSDIEGVLSMCALRRECSEINDVAPFTS